MKWITRERVKVDRVACPWLIRKFVDPQAEFLFVPAEQVMALAEQTGAIPYDVPGVELGHHGKACSFEAILARYNLTSDPALVLLAGLGFMLPGLVLMLLLSWFYVAVGLASPLLAAMFAGCQVAVAALIVRAVHRISEHALGSGWLWGIAIGAVIGQLLGMPFYLSLGGAALLGALSRRRHYLLAGLAAALVVGVAVVFALTGAPGSAATTTAAEAGPPSIVSLFASGLRAGLLTFGGAYTAIPFVQRDAVEVGGWMTNAQFLDGLALSGILPAPLVVLAGSPCPVLTKDEGRRTTAGSGAAFVFGRSSFVPNWQPTSGRLY